MRLKAGWKRLWMEVRENHVSAAWLLTAFWFVAYVIWQRKPLIYAFVWAAIFGWTGSVLSVLYAAGVSLRLRLVRIRVISAMVLLILIGLALWNPPCPWRWLCW